MMIEKYLHDGACCSKQVDDDVATKRNSESHSTSQSGKYENNDKLSTKYGKGNGDNKKKMRSTGEREAERGGRKKEFSLCVGSEGSEMPQTAMLIEKMMKRERKNCSNRKTIANARVISDMYTHSAYLPFVCAAHLTKLRTIFLLLLCFFFSGFRFRLQRQRLGLSIVLEL